MRSSVVPTLVAGLLMVPAAAAASPSDLVARPVVLHRGELVGALTVESAVALGRGASSFERFEPRSLAPDVAYGVTDDLTVAVAHSSRALSVVDSGAGLCVAHACARTYDNFALDARWRVSEGALSAAARVRLVMASFDPWKPQLRLGAVGRWTRGRWAIVADPHLALGLIHRDLGNRAFVNVPVWVVVQPTCRWAIHARTGIRETLAVFGDTYAVPLGVGVTAAATRHIDVAVEAGYARLIGALPEARTIHTWLSVVVRWP